MKHKKSYQSDFWADEDSANLKTRTPAEVFDDLLMILCTLVVCICLGTDERVIRWLVNLMT